MKKIMKIFALILSVMLIFSAIGCFGDNEEYDTEVVDTENDILSGTLNLRTWNAGFGLTWLENVIDVFNEKYPNVKVKLTDTVERMQIFGEVTGKEEKYDVIFSEYSYNDYIDCLENIDDVYAYVNKGETYSIADKLDSMYLKNYKFKGNYYQIPAYVGSYGLVYNTDYISDTEIPVTTDELKNMCNSLKLSTSPIIFSGETGTGYWDFLYCTWYAQYQGREDYSQALLGKVKNESGEYVYDVKSAYLEGELKAMQVCEDLLWYDNGYIKTDSTGLQYLVAQRDFLQGKAAMMYCGSHLMNEMKLMFPNGPAAEFKMMKTPVISAIRERCTTIGDDAELAALVHAIDNGTKSLTGDGYNVNQEDFDRISEARGFYYASSEGATGVIPINARNKTLAKRFLAFMYSEDGIMALANAKAGNVLPVKNSMYKSQLTTKDKYLKSVYDILFNNEIFFNDPSKAVSPCCTDTSAGMIEKQFGSQRASDRTRAVNSYSAKKNLWTADNNDKFWSSLINKGLIKSRP